MEEKEKGNERNTRLWQFCKAVWHDYSNGSVDYEDLSLEKYCKEHGVSKFPKELVAPILLKRSEPTLEDADGLRVSINRYVYSKRSPSREEVKAERMEERDAIAILKNKGYRVMKKTVAYIDL